MFVYLSSNKEPAGTNTKVPDIKYTPSSILIDEPNPVALEEATVADLPALLLIVSPLLNTLLVPVKVNTVASAIV